MESNLPKSMDSGVWNAGHCQGIAVDAERGWIYYSFTTMLVKTDLQGRVLGTVKGLLGHLGCIAFRAEDGRVYGSLEYKSDAIGKGILRHAGSSAQLEDAFYIAIFDGARIDRMDMDAAGDSVMKTVYLREVVDDYLAEVALPDGRVAKHRFGCSGIDGTTFGPMFGAPKDSRRDLYVAYGVYGDESRTDNDYQVLLRYDVTGWDNLAQPLCQEQMHHSGPAAPDGKYFAFTGNTTYGVQNLEYDAFTGDWMMAVYCGKKPQYPNPPMFIVDGHRAPERMQLAGHPEGVAGDVVRLDSHGVNGWSYDHGQTGLYAHGDGRYYVSYDGAVDGGWRTTVRLCRWDGASPLRIEE